MAYDKLNLPDILDWRVCETFDPLIEQLPETNWGFFLSDLRLDDRWAVWSSVTHFASEITGLTCGFVNDCGGTDG